MTRSPQKERERFYVEEAANFLEKNWHLGADREIPDFIVTEDGNQFGLEVIEIFAGPQDDHGAHRKRGESERQKLINDLRSDYKSKDDTPLFVRFVGDICRENLEPVVPTLRELDLATKPFGHQQHFEIDSGPAKLSVYVTRGKEHADWFYVNDRGGWLDCSPVERIEGAINEKAKKLPRYIESAALDDIRLLVVANRRMNSGKLELEGQPALDLKGFRVVYFFSYPEDVTVFENER